MIKIDDSSYYKVEIQDLFNNDLIDFITSIKKNNDIRVALQEKKLKLLIRCRGWEIIWSVVKNALWLSESDVIRVKFTNPRYEGDLDSWIQVEETDKKVYEKLQKEKNTILFIDDLVDNWDTIKKVKKDFWKDIIISVLYTKEWKNKDLTDITVKDLPNKWILFPWEYFYLEA